jgi:hypothetical protein
VEKSRLRPLLPPLPGHPTFSEIENLSESCSLRSLSRSLCSRSRSLSRSFSADFLPLSLLIDSAFIEEDEDAHLPIPKSELSAWPADADCAIMGGTRTPFKRWLLDSFCSLLGETGMVTGTAIGTAIERDARPCPADESVAGDPPGVFLADAGCGARSGICVGAPGRRKFWCENDFLTVLAEELGAVTAALSLSRSRSRALDLGGGVGGAGECGEPVSERAKEISSFIQR